MYMLLFVIDRKRVVEVPMWILLVIIVVFSCCSLSSCQVFDCHDDPGYIPQEGTLTELQFTWLGALQYIHVKQGNPHYFRTPRVALISKQFALCTAIDAAEIPLGYALGNVAFSDYERDESECGVTLQDMEKGVQCDPAILIMPISDVLLHPEYKHFGVKHSVALLKLIMSIRSTYMVPVCLPFKNYLVDEPNQLTPIHIDFPTAVARDFAAEEKEVTRISILSKEFCHLHEPENSTYDRIVCSTGCGFHSGAPTIVHEHTGHWTLVALSTGGPTCPDPLRNRRPPAPPHHIALHPYVPWITTAITGKSVAALANDDPFGFIMPRSSVFGNRLSKRGWVGRWWMGGIRCYDRGEAAIDLYKFYHEIFQVFPQRGTFFTYYLEITAPYYTEIVCVKVGMPIVISSPRIWDLNSQTVKLQIPTAVLNVKFRFQVEAWGFNVSIDTSSSSTDEEEEKQKE